jgi:protein-glutamine gamma-glutamyltransferase
VPFGRTQKILTFVLSAVAAAPLLASGEIGPPFWAASVALFVAGWFLEPPLTLRPRFRRGVTALVVALLAAQVARALLGEPVASLGMEFAAVLLGLKLASRGTAGDYQQIVVLAFLHVIAATIVVDDLSYAASFLTFVLLSPPVLALAHLRSEMESRFAADPRAGDRRTLDRLLASKRVVTGGFLAGSALLSLPVLAVTAVLFVTFPRIGFGLLGRIPSSRSVLGFAAEVKLGDLELTRLEETVLVRLEPNTRPRGTPDRLPLKLRGAVFDTYANSTWKQSQPSKWARMRSRDNHHFLSPRPVYDGAPSYEVYLESMDPPILFVPEGTGLIVTNSMVKAGTLKARPLEMSDAGALRYSDDAKVGIRYEAVLNGSPPPGLAPDARHDGLSLPPEGARLAALARDMAGTGQDRVRAARLVRGLQTRYRYSLAPDPAEKAGAAETPLDRFLFTRRTGSCEHFATALTLMLRAVGIPARLVTGFGSAEWNPIGEYYAVREHSAHSWTEAFIDGAWTTLDATPAAEGAARTPPSTLALLVDALRMRWLKHVVGYDVASQMALAEKVRRGWLGLLGEPGEPGRMRMPRWAPWAGAGAAVLAAAIFAFVRRRRLFVRRAGGGSSDRRDTGEATLLYRALDRRLGRLGLARAPSTTPFEHSASLRSAGSPLAAPVEEITTRYNEARFGGRSFAPGEAERLRRAIRALAPYPKAR